MTTALSHIKSMGVVVSLDKDGSLDVRAQRRMSQQAWDDALEFAKEFKPEIIQDLNFELGLQASEAKKKATPPTAKSVKRPSGSFGSTPGRRFSENQEQPGVKHKRITPSMLHAWRTARPWILDHLQELGAKGWTRKMLFRADVLTYPHGVWGPAWSRNWLRDGVQVSIDEQGAILWTWKEPNGTPVTQASRIKHK